MGGARDSGIVDEQVDAVADKAIGLRYEERRNPCLFGRLGFADKLIEVLENVVPEMLEKLPRSLAGKTRFEILDPRVDDLGAETKDESFERPPKSGARRPAHVSARRLALRRNPSRILSTRSYSSRSI